MVPRYISLPKQLNYAIIAPDSLLCILSSIVISIYFRGVTYLPIVILLCFHIFIFAVTITFDRRRQTSKRIGRLFWITSRLVGVKPPIMKAIDG